MSLESARSLDFAPDGKTLAVLIGWNTDRNVQFLGRKHAKVAGGAPAHLGGAGGAAFTSDSKLRRPEAMTGP